uniref:Uncharacterized protein n=1 Tax=Aegilops tauschii subsp. strangulata TaxID=200361 RepID=A0A453B3H2_AEGTS
MQRNDPEFTYRVQGHEESRIKRDNYVVLCANFRSSESHGSCNQDGVTRDCAHLLGGPDGTVGGARGCSSSTDSLTHPGGSCPIVGSAVSPPCPSQAEDGLPPLPPSNTGAVVRSPSTSARPPSRSSKNEGPQEELAATTSESHIKILTKAQVLEK